jgi:hypothetical protein
MRTKGYFAGLVIVAGGILMLGSGYASRGFLYTALGYAEPRISDFLNGMAANAAVLAITLLELVIALGGLTVLIGGLVIISGHTSIGRMVVYLGGGAGFIGLLVSFGYSVYKLGGIDPVLSYLPYWVGLTLAITGRRLAKSA